MSPRKVRQGYAQPHDSVRKTAGQASSRRVPGPDPGNVTLTAKSADQQSSLEQQARELLQASGISLSESQIAAIFAEAERVARRIRLRPGR